MIRDKIGLLKLLGVLVTLQNLFLAGPVIVQGRKPLQAYQPKKFSSSYFDASVLDNRKLRRRDNSWLYRDRDFSDNEKDNRWKVQRIFDTLKDNTPFAQPSGNYYDYYNDVEDTHTAATNGGGYGGGGGGYGGGGKGLNKSAVGLLGFLSLLSLIQNVLNQRTTTMMGRRKRAFESDSDHTGSWFGHDEAEDIIHLILPMLSAVAHARDRLIPLECTLRKVCEANKIFVKGLKEPGISVGILLSDGIAKLLKPVDPYGKITAMVKQAGKSGRSGNNCKILYRECATLSHLPVYNIPSNIVQMKK